MVLSKEASISSKSYQSLKIVVAHQKLPLGFPYYENCTIGTKKQLDNCNFQSSVTEISIEIDTSFK